MRSKKSDVHKTVKKGSIDNFGLIHTQYCIEHIIAHIYYPTHLKSSTPPKKKKTHLKKT